jgi:hypothetical protein
MHVHGFSTSEYFDDDKVHLEAMKNLDVFRALG